MSKRRGTEENQGIRQDQQERGRGKEGKEEREKGKGREKRERKGRGADRE